MRCRSKEEYTCRGVTTTGIGLVFAQAFVLAYYYYSDIGAQYAFKAFNLTDENIYPLTFNVTHNETITEERPVINETFVITAALMTAALLTTYQIGTELYNHCTASKRSKDPMLADAYEIDNDELQQTSCLRKAANIVSALASGFGFGGIIGYGANFVLKTIIAWMNAPDYNLAKRWNLEAPKLSDFGSYEIAVVAAVATFWATKKGLDSCSGKGEEKKGEYSPLILTDSVSVQVTPDISTYTNVT
jgi:hypothetical protein